MGLRAEKQRRQRVSIIENSIALFRERGIESVRIADIVSACEISDATFFNYFESRDALLCEWARSALESAFARAVDEGGGRSLRREVRGLVARLASSVQADLELSSQAWRRVSVTRLTPRHNVGRGRPSPRDPAMELIEKAVERGELRRDLAPDRLALLLRATLAASLADWLASESGNSRPPLERRLGSAADLMLDAFRRRHERVTSV
jgi:AcrR family transcriptional regulator